MTSHTDFSTLGRLGTTGGGKDARRPRRPVRSVRRRGSAVQVAGIRPLHLLVGAVVVVIGLLLAVGVALDGQTGSLAAVARAAPAMDPALETALRSGAAQSIVTGSVTLTPGGGAATGSVEAPPAFAAVDDLALHLPTAQSQDVLFLEADNPAALPLAPVGVMARNDNPEGFTPVADFAGPSFAIAPPISGVRPATGMAALLAAPGTALLAPVQGIVTAVEPYTDEGGAEDVRVTIQPDGRTDLQVVLRRVEAPLVTVGQALTVGVTPIGTVRGGQVFAPDQNPLSLPAALLHVRPATADDDAGAVPSAG